MKVGDVVGSKTDGKNRELYVITKMKNGQISDLELLKTYVAKNTIIYYDGTDHTLEEIVNLEVQKYIEENDFHDNSKE